MSFSSDKPDRYRWQPQLEEFATHLDAINEPSEHEDIFYEYMSGALIWRDEFNQDTPSDVIQALRRMALT